MDGFTDVLLPTDRWPWSDVTGMNPQPLHSFQLPSRSWEWEGDWYVDQSCGGEPSQTGVRTTLDSFVVCSSVFLVILLIKSKPFGCTLFSPQGWEYAVDFPANFSPEKKWNSCVRRRRWIRYRRYTAQGTWAKVCKTSLLLTF